MKVLIIKIRSILREKLNDEYILDYKEILRKARRRLDKHNEYIIIIYKYIYIKENRNSFKPHQPNTLRNYPNMLLFVLSVFLPQISYHPFGREATFDQLVDHFSMSDTRTFKQRCFFNSTFYRNVSSDPIIVYIEGEAEFSESSISSGPIIDIARETNALIAGLEHRFFGKSQPFGSLNASSLYYNTVDQALADLAHFIAHLRRTYCARGNETNGNCSVLVVGGSYAGALSSWFRLYYPHLANFSWASSAPINIKKKFLEYDASIANVLRDYNESCYLNTKLLMSGYHQIVAQDPQDPQKINELRTKFSMPESIDITSLLSILTDVISYAVQYNKVYQMIESYCVRQSSAVQPDEASLLDLYNNVLTVLKMTAEDLDPFTYKDTDPDSANAAMRAWTWMQCNELGWFSTSAGFKSSFVNLTYYDRVCAALFDNMTVGNISAVARRYGGANPRSSYVVFTQGTADPWSTMGVESIDNSNSQYLFYIKDGSHCEDLRGDSPDDSEYLKDVRAKVKTILIDWLNNKCEKKCDKGTCLHDKCLCDEGWSGEYCTFQVVTTVRFWEVSITALMVPLIIMISIGGTTWWLFRRMQEEQFLLSLHY